MSDRSDVTQDSNYIFRAWARGLTVEGISEMLGKSVEEVNEALDAELATSPG